MATLATWLQEQLARRNLTQQATVAYASASVAPAATFIKRSQLPCLEILFHFTDYVQIPREHVMLLISRMPIEGRQPVVPDTCPGGECDESQETALANGQFAFGHAGFSRTWRSSADERLLQHLPALHHAQQLKLTLPLGSTPAGG